MGNYSIKDLETLSGIKAHTLRIWEQRYGIINPQRTDTNIRFYDDNDLKRILNISLLNQNGYKISKIAQMSTVDLNETVFGLVKESVKYPDQVQALMMSMMEMDEDRFDKTISRAILQFGVENAMINIVYPFLTKLGLLWQIGTVSPYQEHFISNLIRQKIIVAIDGQAHVPVTKKKFLLYLPETELHEIGLLFATYILKSRGFKVFYFGQALPLSDLVNACRMSKTDCTFTVATSLSKEDAVEFVEKLSTQVPETTHIISGQHFLQSEFGLSNVVVLGDAQKFIEYIDK